MRQMSIGSSSMAERPTESREKKRVLSAVVNDCARKEEMDKVQQLLNKVRDEVSLRIDSVGGVGRLPSIDGEPQHSHSMDNGWLSMSGRSAW